MLEEIRIFFKEMQAWGVKLRLVKSINLRSLWHSTALLTCERTSSGTVYLPSSLTFCEASNCQCSIRNDLGLFYQRQTSKGNEISVALTISHKNVKLKGRL